ncbi:MAG: hypothetical protein COZ80_10305 [Ignavibacteria bacterium CG_4_8_14_3_um_filter_37_9]|nr:hypothetical protein [Ignavibacteria bacterium]NCS90271.1 hypothetical protein [Ignavibacteria bacterium]OIO14926.1 MAG: hypothetical protein AUJ54_13635 [Ignavibacteria bacterium CG1_02_37_35]PIW98501.1 MAG: hypothetical protein COZ80_10305 [Ignavibacteria bacterium CG_4_8_14_3_um_filter_37_9]PJC60576.1 MAG: hypothetical protein CO025_02785 [Ignavibacteria bacterium CG_4_9_14_0_2_um_filter_37_13]
MKNTFNAILFISISISMVSCEKPIESFDNSVLYPISTGNYWKYKIFTYSGEKILPNLTDSLLIAIDNEIIVNLEGKTYRGGYKQEDLEKTLMHRQNGFIQTYMMVYII